MKRFSHILFTIFCLFIFTGSQLSAQKKKSLNSRIYELSQRTLIVIEETPSKYVEHRLKRNETALNRYYQDIEGYNRIMKEAIEEEWDWTLKVEFMSWEEMMALKKEKAEGYAWMDFSKYRDVTLGAYSAWDGMTYDSTGRYAKWTSESNFLRFHLLEEKTPLYSQPLPNLTPSKGDLITALRQAADYLQHRSIGGYLEEYLKDVQTRIPQLGEKTLLFDGNLLSEEIGDSTIGEVYPYPYKVVSWTEIEQAILNKDEKYAYVVLQPVLFGGPEALSERPNLDGPHLLRGFQHAIFDAGNGEMLGFYNYSPKPRAFKTGWVIGKDQINAYLEPEQEKGRNRRENP